MLARVLAFALGGATAWNVTPHAPRVAAGLGPRAERSPVAIEPHRVKVARKSETVVTTGPATVRFVVTLRHLHTRERLGIATIAPADEVARFLRCRVTGNEHEIASPLVPLARRIAVELGADVIDVVSGFRSPKLNEMLRKKGREVAADSQHTHGTALDFKIPGTPAVELARRAKALHRGGIGTYRENGFIHVDVGRPRQWSGR
jgi:uncharacterized protein YcbK (DUF882 family)